MAKSFHNTNYNIYAVFFICLNFSNEIISSRICRKLSDIIYQGSDILLGSIP
jgi:hypothetical protein